MPNMKVLIKSSIWTAGVLFFWLASMAHSFHSRATPPHAVYGIDNIIINYFYPIELFIFVVQALAFRKTERIVLSWIVAQNFICLFILIEGIKFHVFAVSHPAQ